MNKTHLKEYWDKRRAENERLKTKGCIIDIVRSGNNHARLRVVAPYNSDFAIGARELLGTWRPRTKVWTFDTRCYRLLLRLCKRIYGGERVFVCGYKGLLEEKDRDIKEASE